MALCAICVQKGWFHPSREGSSPVEPLPPLPPSGEWGRQPAADNRLKPVWFADHKQCWMSGELSRANMSKGGFKQQECYRVQYKCHLDTELCR